MIGTVVKSTGSWYLVRAEGEDELIPCRIIGKFRLKGEKLTNPVAVGDKVIFELEDIEEKSGLITKIEDRTNYIARKSPRRKHHLHLMASNVDQVILFVTIIHPNLKVGFIDRFLLMTEPFDIPVWLVFNKADVYGAEELDIYECMKMIYEDIGYHVHLVSATEKTGTEELKAILKDKTTLVAGHSGVGKSTLINAIQPQIEIDTQDISDFSGKGQHTTTFAEMHPLDFGGYIIDTPGIKSLAFTNMDPEEIGHYFKEFLEYCDDCKFNNCKHLNEPKCAVKDAVEEGKIHILRYENYVQLMDETMDQNHWEINRDF